ncbi:argonaute-like protein [Phellopilus nigrolimitatus]|nr:argonaute-like protein [Phellopilus nigrolimitatus]
MPPRISPSTSRGGGRGGPPTRGGAPRGAGGSQVAVAPSAGSHITTIGVKRSAYGTSGIARSVLTNHFPISIPQGVISHYDVVITPSEKTLPARLNMDLITHLQTYVAPNVFSPKAVYDGRKNLFAASTLKFPNGENSCEFDVCLSDTRTADVQRPSDKGPKVYKIRLNKVAEINPIVLERFLEGKQSHDNDVLTAITALNVVVRMEPTQKYPFNVRSFFTQQEKKELGLGIELWRGYFQSVRPAVGKMLINIDISTGTMYKPGPLIDLCLEFVGKQGQPLALATKRGFPERERLRLQRFISGIRVLTTHADEAGRVSKTPRVVKKLSPAGAADLQFNTREGGTMKVADYFKRVTNKPLRFPDLPCVEVGSGALLPLELCVVPAGQIMRKQVPPELTKNVLEFATKRPEDRLNSIRKGLSVLSYGQSDYVRQFGMHMEPNTDALKVSARVLPTPTLRYGQGSRAPAVTPRDGAWNMIDRRFYRPSEIKGWVVVVYERVQRFNMEAAQNMIDGLLASFKEVGIGCPDTKPLVKYENGQGKILDQLRSAGQEYNKNRRVFPTLIVAVLPEGGTDIYTSIKHFGDCVAGVSTQCLKSSKCFRAKPQYYANVCLKINVKLGGINTIPDPASVRYLTDPANPTIIMGADVIHPAPGSEGRPSFTSVVGNVDSDTSKYIATTRVQTSRKEMIDDLEEMVKHIVDMYRKYRRNIEKKANFEPKRIIFYRDGVSEGQFQQVIDYEVPKLRNACKSLGINPLPKITVIVVGKRHHVRFFPVQRGEGDRSGNCPAGTVVDRDVTSPAEFDFYLQSHGGLLGTSRPAHYNVLLDENEFTPDGLQQLSFALCHVYARSTRSVSIPAPVYYADIVCSRAKNHFNPEATDGFNFSDSATQPDDQQANATLEMYKKNFKNLHNTTALSMYFS